MLVFDKDKKLLLHWINLLNIRAMKTLFRYSILWIQPRPPTNTKKEHYSIIPRTNFLLFSGSIISREPAIGSQKKFHMCCPYILFYIFR